MLRCKQLLPHIVWYIASCTLQRDLSSSCSHTISCRVDIKVLSHAEAGFRVFETRTRGSQSSCSTGAGSAVDLKDMDRDRDGDAEYWPQQTEEAQHPLQRVGSHGSWHMHNERPPPTPDDGKQLAMRIVSMCCSSCSVPDFLEMQLRLMHCVAFCSLRHYNACWTLCELYCHTMHSRSIV